LIYDDMGRPCGRAAVVEFAIGGVCMYILDSVLRKELISNTVTMAQHYSCSSRLSRELWIAVTVEAANLALCIEDPLRPAGIGDFTTKLSVCATVKCKGVRDNHSHA
jgi:hypothetical protein